MLRKSSNPFWSLLLLMWLLAASSAFGQGTAFTYQGKLTDGGSPANGTYDFEFKLYDTAALGTGTQFGTTQTLTSVAVSSGIFTVQLDFGACPACFNGAARFLEIAVRPTGGGSFTTLGPRQPLTSAPYALRSQSAAAADGLSVACVNCVISSQIGSVAGGAVTGTIPVASVPAGSANYIQNSTSAQASSNFNISGNGTAGGTLAGGIVNATTQYNLGGQRLLSAAGTGNLFAGINAGTNNTGAANAFFGSNAGAANTTANENSFFGSYAGAANTTGAFNTFFGDYAGAANTTANDNSFFGSLAGYHTTATLNSFFGSSAGWANTTANENAFFGSYAGYANTIADENAFFGSYAGYVNTIGALNAFFGSNAGRANTTACCNAFFGYRTGYANTTGENNAFVGWLAGYSNTTGYNNAFFGSDAGSANTTGYYNTYVGYQAMGAAGLNYATAIGAGATASASNTVVLGRSAETVIAPGLLQVNTLGAAGSTQLCRNASNQVATCSSSLRYKTEVRRFSSGLDLLNRLRPISFTWKQGGAHDIGLAAEEVEKVEPLLITHNDKGEVEGVKYDRVAVVLVNAVKEQQAQIAQQRRQLAQQVEQLQRQQAQIEALKKLVCLDHAAAHVCK